MTGMAFLLFDLVLRFDTRLLVPHVEDLVDMGETFWWLGKER